MLGVLIYAVVIACSFSAVAFVGFKFASDKQGASAYRFTVPVIILAMILLLSYLGYGVIFGVVYSASH